MSLNKQIKKLFMSYTETCVGKLKKLGVYEKPLGLEIYCRLRLKKTYPEKYNDYKENGFPAWIDNWFEALDNELFNVTGGELFYNEKTGELWESYNVKSLDEEYFCELINEGADTYTFVTQFYNGGTCLSEILEDEIEELS